MKVNRRSQLVEALTVHIVQQLEEGNLEEVSFLRKVKANIVGRSNYLQTGTIQGSFERWWLRNKRSEEYPKELSSTDLGIDTTYSVLNGVVFANDTTFTGDWSYSEFEDAIMIGAKFVEGLFNDVNFSGAKLERAKLTSSDFRSANFSNAMLSGADLRPIDDYYKRAFYKADFGNADLSRALLQGADLSETLNLHTARLQGASYDEDTKFPVNFPNLKDLKYAGSDPDRLAAQSKADEFWMNAARGILGIKR